MGVASSLDPPEGKPEFVERNMSTEDTVRRRRCGGRFVNSESDDEPVPETLGEHTVSASDTSALKTKKNFEIV